MPTFNIDGRTINYEEYGEGEPLVVLNGIFMSCASWHGFVPAFSAGFRLLLLDFADQGLSARVEEGYTQELQERIVIGLLDHMGIEAAHLCGISYGGEVAMKVAARHPERVLKLILSNTTAYTSPWLRDIGHSWEYAFSSRDGRQFFKTCIPIIYSPAFYEANHEWLRLREDFFVKAFTPEVYDAFMRLSRSAADHDARSVLDQITAPTLVISAEEDYVTPIANQREIVSRIAQANHVVIPHCGHAAMYERPVEFTSLVVGFLTAASAAPTIA